MVSSFSFHRTPWPRINVLIVGWDDGAHRASNDAAKTEPSLITGGWLAPSVHGSATREWFRAFAEYSWELILISLRNGIAQLYRDRVAGCGGSFRSFDSASMPGLTQHTQTTSVDARGHSSAPVSICIVE
jgi:hypothetical protein